MKKIVFLPISPLMWEGFQTIWEDAVENPENIVKVIPIPTYNRDSENNLSGDEYLTNGYPDLVRITDINSYNLETEHPDIIYIQNANDTGTLGFTVHPYFYTSNIKNFTDNLTYIQYTCWPELPVNNHEYLEDLRTMLIPEGINNVDHIIVQSQNMKDVYLHLLAGASAKQLEYWESRISYDNYPRVCLLNKHTSKSDIVPTDWLNIMKKPDESFKKTYLLCISIMDMLENNRQKINEIKEILDSFKEKKEDTALIFRPYPNMEKVLERLRPELYSEYRELINAYVKNNIGILDTTPTPTSAIMASDFYMGSPCGVSELFKSTGKPILA